MACITSTNLLNPSMKPSLVSINHMTKRLLRAKIYACNSFQISTNIANKIHDSPDDHIITRRSADYEPCTWKFDQIQLHQHAFLGERHMKRANKLKEQVNIMLHTKEVAEVDQLELIDDLQRLGLSYHFETQIKQILTTIYNKLKSMPSKNDNLYATALQFRLLRQHSFNVSQDIFDRFIEKDGEILPSLYEDTKAILNLYEASYLLVEDENKLDMIIKFANKHLKKKLDDKNLDEEDCEMVRHALEMPLHWRMPRVEARWFIDIYEKKANKNHIVLELAKLDFNIVQAKYLQDVKYMSRWWQRIGFAEKLTFARDRIVENFFWTIGFTFEPQYSYTRKVITRVNSFITTIDDVYDVYGTLDELELFTHTIERWDINGIKQLPEYMQVCFLELDNHVNMVNIVYEEFLNVHEEEAQTIIVSLRKAWGDLCKAYLQEARWYSSGYTPTLEEYLNNAWISISAPTILTHVYFLVTSPPFEEEGLHSYHDLIRCSSMILRLVDDLGTSSEEIKRGDVPKSIQCYMNEYGVSEEKARGHIKVLIGDMWKKMNKLDGIAKSNHFSENFIRIAKNVSRTAQCMYEHGDGHGHQDAGTKNRIFRLIFDPIYLA